MKLDEYKTFFTRAVKNIIDFGDTDIFPFPIDSHIFYDQIDDVVNILIEIHTNFDDYLSKYPPETINSLVPINYTGFRWATQFDPYWNVYMLGLLLSISTEIENERIPVKSKTIYSHRIEINPKDSGIYKKNIGYQQFIERSLSIAKTNKYFGKCDISDFYQRVGHHNIENALKQLDIDPIIPGRIIKILSIFSNTRSSGLPIGGPAARIISELILNSTDKLLKYKGIKFCRFADDYHIFAKTENDVYFAIFFLSEKLVINDGLSLQKSKTRISTCSSFISENALGEPNGSEESLTRSLFRFHVRFNPYSEEPEKEYEKNRKKLTEINLLGLLKKELEKSSIDVSLGRKLIQAVRYLGKHQKEMALTSMLNNAELLYPVFSSVMILAYQIHDDLTSDAQDKAHLNIRKLIDNKSHVVLSDVVLSFMVRVLGKKNTPENEELLANLFDSHTSPLVRRDIILIMGKWKVFHWLVDLKNNFRRLSDFERRSFIIASYSLKDAGSHWRQSLKKEFSPFETITVTWAAKKTQKKSWEIPI